MKTIKIYELGRLTLQGSPVDFWRHLENKFAAAKSYRVKKPTESAPPLRIVPAPRTRGIFRRRIIATEILASAPKDGEVQLLVQLNLGTAVGIVIYLLLLVFLLVGYSLRGAWSSVGYLFLMVLVWAVIIALLTRFELRYHQRNTRELLEDLEVLAGSKPAA
ncbi:MAG: hypothetical protein AAFR05_13820 [Bacteroidota bacterium]